METINTFKIPVTTRDLEILGFIWKWKLVTTATIFKIFFSNSVGCSAPYNTLRRLQRRGFLCVAAIKAARSKPAFVWGLTKRGFTRVREQLPFEMEEGFESEVPNHDFIASAVHLGPLSEKLRPIEHFTEQELRRIPASHYPEWVPKTSLHRPDGYWLVEINGKQATVALEVELNLKRREDYELVARFYSAKESVFRVVWIAKDIRDASYLEETIKQTYPDRGNAHDFVLLDDVKKYGWGARISLGRDKDKTLYVLLQNGLSEYYQSSDTLPNLDGRSFPYDLRPYGGSQFTRKSDRPPKQVFSPNTVSVPTPVPLLTTLNPISGPLKPINSEGNPYEKNQCKGTDL